MTWWVDQSCEQKIGPDIVDQMMGEAVRTATWVGQRLQRPSEEQVEGHAGWNALYGYKLDAPGAYEQSAMRTKRMPLSFDHRIDPSEHRRSTRKMGRFPS